MGQDELRPCGGRWSDLHHLTACPQNNFSNSAFITEEATWRTEQPCWRESTPFKWQSSTNYILCGDSHIRHVWINVLLNLLSFYTRRDFLKRTALVLGHRGCVLVIGAFKAILWDSLRVRLSCFDLWPLVRLFDPLLFLKKTETDKTHVWSDLFK